MALLDRLSQDQRGCANVDGELIIFELPPVQEACIHIRDAIQQTRHIHPRRGTPARISHIVALAMEPLTKMAVALLMLLTFFDLPCWCARNSNCAATLHDGRLTGDYYSGRPFFLNNRTEHDAVIYPLLGLYILPTAWSSAFELVLHFFLVFHLGCLVHSIGLRRFMSDASKYKRAQLAYAAVVLVSLLDAAVRTAAPRPAGYTAPFLRVTILALSSDTIVKELRLILHTLKPLGGSALVLAIFLVVMAWLGILLWSSPNEGSQGKTYFTSLWATLWELFILLTTANYPDVMMPAYGHQRLSFLFFFVFVSFGSFFMCNFIVAVVFNAYNSAVEAHANERDSYRKERFDEAFNLLCGHASARQPGVPEEHLSREVLKELFKELNLYRSLGIHINADHERIIFAALDRDCNGSVSRDEFTALALLLAIRFRRRHDNVGPCGHAFPGFFRSRCFLLFSACVRHKAFEICVDALLLANLTLLIVEEHGILDGSAPRIDYANIPWARPTAIFFASFFAVELGIKMLVFGVVEFFSKKVNWLDGAVTIVTLVTAAYVFSIPPGKEGIVRYVLTLRLGRFLRLLGIIPQVVLVVDTFVHMIPAASKLLKVLFACMYTISSLGVVLFGGLINKGPQLKTLQQNASDFYEADYFANNFNDVGSGMIVCFELLVVNNWYEICDGFTAVAPFNFGWGAGSEVLVRLFFVSVYVFGVLVSLNIVLAFAIEAFEAVKLGATANDDAEWDAPVRITIPQRLQRSPSICEAQRRLSAIIPPLSPEASHVRELLKSSKRRISIDPISAKEGSELSIELELQGTPKR